MAKRHIVYVVSLLEKSLAMEWTAVRLHREFRVTFLLMNPRSSPLETFLRGSGIPVHRIPFRGRIDYVTSFLRVLFALLRLRPDVVHAHLWGAQLIGLSCAWLLRIKGRIYTRHTSNYHHIYHPSGIKYDRLCNRMATRIVSISQATERVLLDLEGQAAAKIVRIPHGFDFDAFNGVTPQRIERVRSTWKFPDGGPVIGVISRHIEWKGVQYVVPAFIHFLQKYPEALLVLANATGPFKAAIVDLIGVNSRRVVFIPFEEDVVALYHTFDMFVHVPVDSLSEAFGQTYIEALACGIPSVFTRSGIAHEFVQDRIHALVVDYRNSDAIAEAMELLWKDSSLRDRLSSNGKAYVEQHFGFQQMIDKLVGLYNE